MRDLTKRLDEDLVVHKPTVAGAGGGALDLANLPFDADRLAARLRAAGNAAERAQLLAAIQGRFGNAFAARVVDAARSPGAPAPAAPGDV